MSTAPTTVQSTQSQTGRERRQQRPVRLPRDLWAKLDALAQTSSVSTNALIEEIAARLTVGAHAVAPATAAADSDEPPSRALRRLSIRVRETDREALRQHAAAMGLTTTGWVTSLIRARVRKAPLFARQEVEALIECVKALGAVGRNLNTVVHRLHREGTWHGTNVLYNDLLAEVRHVAAHVQVIIAAAHDRAEE